MMCWYTVFILSEFVSEEAPEEDIADEQNEPAGEYTTLYVVNICLLITPEINTITLLNIPICNC